MNCPNCYSEVKQNELANRYTSQGADWYEFTKTEIHCPYCDAKVTFNLASQVVGGIGFIIYIAALVVNLHFPGNPYKFQVYLLGLCIYALTMMYWHRNKKLTLVK